MLPISNVNSSSTNEEAEISNESLDEITISATEPTTLNSSTSSSYSSGEKASASSLSRLSTDSTVKEGNHLPSLTCLPCLSGGMANSGQPALNKINIIKEADAWQQTPHPNDDAIKRKKSRKKKKKCDLKSTCFHLKNKYTRFSFYRNNHAYFLTILFYVLIQVFFVLLQLLVLHPNVNVYVKFARAGGILLNFNSCLIILLVLRRTNTLLRNSIIGRHYPVLDEFLKFHKIIGFWILFLSIMHTVAHAINLCKFRVPTDHNKIFII